MALTAAVTLVVFVDEAGTAFSVHVHELGIRVDPVASAEDTARRAVAEGSWHPCGALRIARVVQLEDADA